MNKILISIIFIISVLNSFSQVEKNGKQVKIVSKYKSSLADIIKQSYKPSIKDTVVTSPSFDYFLKSKAYYSSFNLIEKEYPKYEENKEVKLERAYLRMSLGNYSRFDGEFAYNTPKDKNYNLGILANTNSISGSIDKKEIGFVNQSILAYYNKKKAENSYGATISYDNRLLHFYSLVKDENYTKERRGQFNSVIYYDRKTDRELRYGGKFSYTNFKDSYTSLVENYMKINSYGEIDFMGGNLNLNLEIDYLSSENNFLSFSLYPNYYKRWKIFTLNLGIELKDLIAEKSKLYFAPKVNVNASIYDKFLSIYAMIDGGVIYNNYFRVYKTNPFVIISGNEIVKPTFNKYTYGGGIYGRFDKLFWYNINATYSNIEDFSMFVLNEQSEPYAVFKQIYKDIKLFTFNTEIGVNFDDNLALVSKYTHYYYDNNKTVFNKPKYELSISGKYYLGDFSFGSNFIILGERDVSKDNGFGEYYKDGTNGAIIDWSFNSEYKYSKYFYIFGQVNNILNKNYEKWNSYPSIGFNILAGFTMCF